MTFTFSHALDYVFGTALALWIASILVRVVGESIITTIARLSVAWQHGARRGTRNVNRK